MKDSNIEMSKLCYLVGRVIRVVGLGLIVGRWRRVVGLVVVVGMLGLMVLVVSIVDIRVAEHQVLANLQYKWEGYSFSS